MCGMACRPHAGTTLGNDLTTCVSGRYEQERSRSSPPRHVNMQEQDDHLMDGRPHPSENALLRERFQREWRRRAVVTTTH